MEGALKLKEIGYLHAEGYSGGALKHGPFAMIEDEKEAKRASKKEKKLEKKQRKKDKKSKDK